MAYKPAARSTGREKEAKAMPQAAKKLCTVCRQIGGCKCRKEPGRKSARDRGYTNQWDIASKHWREVNPLCAECDRQGRLTPANVVDHVRPHKGNQEWFWDQSNWESTCTHCHNVKTRMEANLEHYGRTVVTGPPGSGKTTYVNARRKPGDLVWDWDYVAREMTGLPLHETPEDLIPHLNGMAETLCREVATRPPKRNVWIILANQGRARAVAGLMSGEVVELQQVFTRRQV